MNVLHRALCAAPVALSLLLAGCTTTGATSSPPTTSGTATTSSPPATSAPPATGQPGPTTAPTPVADPGWVTGRVVDAAGRPVAGALVETLQRRDVPESGLLQGRTPRRGWTKADGSFRVRQPSYGYLVRACFPIPGNRRVCQETAQGSPYLWSYAGPSGFSESWVTQLALFPASESDRAIGVMPVSPPAKVVGRLVGQPFAEVRVMRLNDTVAFRGQTDPAGNFVVRGLAAGPYYVAAGGVGALPWRSETFTLKQGATHRVGAVELEPGATLAGTLTTADGVAGYTDVLVIRDGEGVVAATTSDGRGRFRVSGFTAGRYRVEIPPGGGVYQQTGRWVQVASASGTYRASFRAVRGAELVVPLRASLDPAHSRIRDELRDSSGQPVQANRNNGRFATYSGLAPGRYTVVAATADHYATRTVDVTGPGRRVLPALKLGLATFTLSGTTAPSAVVEATTGNLCPPGGVWRLGGFHLVEKAEPDGSYVLSGLVPGTYMLGADGWPGSYAPQCWPDVELTADSERDLPLQPGGVATGRLVYADNGGPVIADLSYELTYGTATPSSPTDEHPARARVQGEDGQFTIKRLSAGTVNGALAPEANLDQITSAAFLVIHPYQDGTPYWLESDTVTYQVGPGQALALGDVPLTVQPQNWDY